MTLWNPKYLSGARSSRNIITFLSRRLSAAYLPDALKRGNVSKSRTISPSAFQGLRVDPAGHVRIIIYYTTFGSNIFKEIFFIPTAFSLLFLFFFQKNPTYFIATDSHLKNYRCRTTDDPLRERTKYITAR